MNKKSILIISFTLIGMVILVLNTLREIKKSENIKSLDYNNIIRIEISEVFNEDILKQIDILNKNDIKELVEIMKESKSILLSHPMFRIDYNLKVYYSNGKYHIFDCYVKEGDFSNIYVGDNFLMFQNERLYKYFSDKGLIHEY